MTFRAERPGAGRSTHIREEFWLQQEMKHRYKTAVLLAGSWERGGKMREFIIFKYKIWEAKTRQKEKKQL